jgi:hypothetical protein
MTATKRSRKPGFESEVALCAEFITQVTKGDAWVAYAETGGWDILLVRREDGFQIGIEAKLILNNTVAVQALPERWYGAAEIGPDCRAVLVPEGGKQNGLGTICNWLGLTVITIWPPSERVYRRRFEPDLPHVAERWGDDRHWHEWCPVKRVALPDYVPDSGAGHSAPVQLTAWKIKALKIVAILERRPVTRRDFKLLGLDAARWTQIWLDATAQGYVASSRMPDFKSQHPVVFEQIKADAAKWMVGELASTPAAPPRFSDTRTLVGSCEPT